MPAPRRSGHASTSTVAIANTTSARIQAVQLMNVSGSQQWGIANST